MKILLASNSHDVIARAGSLFTSPSSEIVHVLNNNELILLVNESQFDLLILDERFDGFQAIEILPILRRLSPDLPIILLEENTDYENEKLIVSYGVVFRIIRMNFIDTNTDIDYYRKAFLHISNWKSSKVATY